MTPPGRAIADLAGRHPAAFATTVAYAAAFAGIAGARGDARIWAFLIVLTIGMELVALADRAAHFSPGLIWALTGFGFAHLCGGLLPAIGDGPTFYETWIVHGVLKYDQLVHFGGSFIATVVAWQLIGNYLDHDRTRVVVQAQLAAAIGLGKGAINEVLEFLASQQLDNTAIGSGTNTSWDLVFNMAGVVAAALWLALSGAPRSTSAAGDQELGTGGRRRVVAGVEPPVG